MAVSWAGKMVASMVAKTETKKGDEKVVSMAGKRASMMVGLMAGSMVVMTVLILVVRWAEKMALSMVEV